MTTAIPFQQQNEIFRKMQELSEFINMSSEDQDTYERELDKYITYIDSINFAKKESFEIGVEKGKKEGIEIGVEKGKKEGIEIGVEKERIKTAKAMKEQGIDIKTIITCTNLSKEEIEKL